MTFLAEVHATSNCILCLVACMSDQTLYNTKLIKNINSLEHDLFYEMCKSFELDLSKTSKEIEDKGIYLLGDILLELLFLEKKKNGSSSFDTLAHNNGDLYLFSFRIIHLLLYSQKISRRLLNNTCIMLQQW